MAQDLKPGTWITGWTEDGTNIAIANLATAFPEMTAAEADATTGDIRKVLFAIMEQLWAKWLTVSVADRPAMMTIYRSTATDGQTGVVTKQFVVVFKTAVLTQDVAAEA